MREHLYNLFPRFGVQGKLDCIPGTSSTIHTLCFRKTENKITVTEE